MAKHTAFEILYKEYYGRVFGLCRRLLASNQLAEDATQETFMRAYKRFGKFDSEQPFWRWIAAIANNHCVDVLRARSRSDALFGEEATEENLATTDASALSNLVSAENEDVLHSAISQLNDKYRVPLVLAYFHQCSYDEISEHLGISRNHVGVLLLRGKQQLRTLLTATPAEVTL